MSTRDEAVVAVSGVTKRYRGREVLAGASITVHSGEVVGLIGPNGAGKSTLLGVLGGFVRPQRGGGEVLGRRLREQGGQWPLIGVMPEKPAFIEHMSGRNNLRMLAAIRGRLSRAEVDDALRAVGLDPRDRRPVRSHSQGMRQRLSLAQAVMEAPRLLLLDEPTNGLDPHGIALLRSVVRGIAKEGSGVVFASHLLSEVTAVSDRIVVVQGGRTRNEFGPHEFEGIETAYLSLVPEAAR